MTGDDTVPGDAVPEDTVPDDDAPGAEPVPEGNAATDPSPVAEPDGEPDEHPGDEPDPDPDADDAGLNAADREILALENLQWKYQGAKEMEIRRRLNLSPTHYYQRLNVLIDTRAALEHDPMLVARLRRQRGDHG